MVGNEPDARPDRGDAPAAPEATDTEPTLVTGARTLEQTQRKIESIRPLAESALARAKRIHRRVSTGAMPAVKLPKVP